MYRKLQEAKAKLKQLQSLLATVEELRQCGQPVPESIIQLLNAASSADDRSSTPPSQQDRYYMKYLSEILLTIYKRQTHQYSYNLANFLGPIPPCMNTVHQLLLKRKEKEL